MYSHLKFSSSQPLKARYKTSTDYWYWQKCFVAPRDCQVLKTGNRCLIQIYLFIIGALVITFIPWYLSLLPVGTLAYCGPWSISIDKIGYNYFVYDYNSLSGIWCEYNRLLSPCDWANSSLWPPSTSVATITIMTVQTRPVLHSVSMVTTVVAIVTDFSAVVPGPLSQHVFCPLGCPNA